MYNIRTLVLWILGICLATSASAQINLFGLEYTFRNPGNPNAGGWQEFVQINTNTGSKLVLDTVWDVGGVLIHSSTFDQTNGRYVFHGLDSSHAQVRLYNINSRTGAVTSRQPTLHRPANELEWDMRTGKLYGLFWNDISKQEFLVEVDPQTGVQTPILLLPGVKYIQIGGSALDGNTGKYYFMGTESSGFRFLYEVDIAGLSMRKVTSLTDNYYELTFDQSRQKLIAATRASTLAAMEIVEINTLQGDTTHVVDLASLSGQFAGLSVGASVFDQNSHTYIIHGRNQQRDSIYFVDIVNQTYRTVPMTDNVIELECDNVGFAKRYFGSTTAQDPKLNTLLRFLPNPTSDWVQVTLPVGSPQAKLQIMDAAGRVYREMNIVGAEARIDVSFLRPGVYVITLETPTGSQSARLIKQ